MRRPLVIDDFATALFWISLFMRNIWFFFYQCTIHYHSLALADYYQYRFAREVTFLQLLLCHRYFHILTLGFFLLQHYTFIFYSYSSSVFFIYALLLPFVKEVFCNSFRLAKSFRANNLSFRGRKKIARICSCRVSHFFAKTFTNHKYFREIQQKSSCSQNISKISPLTQMLLKCLAFFNKVEESQH